MSKDQDKIDSRSMIIFIGGIIFVVGSILAFVGIGKYTDLFKEKAESFIKESADRNSQVKGAEINSQDSPYLEKMETLDELNQNSSGDLDVAPSPADYGFQMDVQKASQQKESASEYSVPTSTPNQPGSKEWQDKFWSDQ